MERLLLPPVPHDEFGGHSLVVCTVLRGTFLGNNSALSALHTPRQLDESETLIEIYQLRTFAAVAEFGQLTRASEALHISQPAVTAQIKALEDEFQVSLFERTSTGMILTKAGQQLLIPAGEVLRSVQRLKNEGKALLGEIAGRIGIGTLSTPDVIRLGPFLNSVVGRFPLIELELHHQVSGMAPKHVRDGTLDASFYYGELNNSSLRGIHLRDMVYCVAAPAAWNHKVDDKEWPTIAALPWVLAPSISTHNRLLRSLFDKQGAPPTKVVETDHESAINSLIASGVGLSLMLEEQALAAQVAGEVVIWGDTRLHTSLWFIHAAERTNDPLIQAITEVIGDTWDVDVIPKLKPVARSMSLHG